MKHSFSFCLHKKDQRKKGKAFWYWELVRAVNSLIGFLSESLFFCKKMRWAIRSKKQAIHSFLVSDLSDSLTVAHLSWATWAICSQSLICLQRSEQIAHSLSFDLSEMSKEAMSEWANSQPWDKIRWDRGREI